MRRNLILLLLGLLGLMATTGCGVRVFISDTRLRGTVPPPEVLNAQATAEAEAAAQATPTLSREQEQSLDDVIDDLEGRVGEDLTALSSFSGRETPNAGPLRGMRVEPGDSIRISAGRSQEIAVEAGEYCVDTDDGEVCSRVWVHGRPAGGSLGAWYPIIVFELPSGG